jgi:hypothetical protein
MMNADIRKHGSGMKGQWKTVESVMAGVVILMFVAALGATRIQSSPVAPANGYRALETLYKKGSLRSPAFEMDCAAIDALVSGTGYLGGYNHAVSVCNGSVCCGQVPQQGDIWTSSMLIAGKDSYKPVEVILYVTRK